jgi:hypothetical protein
MFQTLFAASRKLITPLARLQPQNPNEIICSGKLLIACQRLVRCATCFAIAFAFGPSRLRPLSGTSEE